RVGQAGVVAGGRSQVNVQDVDVRDGDLRLLELHRNARATVAATTLHRSEAPAGCAADSALLALDRSRLTLDQVELREDGGDGTALTTGSERPVVLRRSSILGFAIGVNDAAAPADLGRAG